jgi:apolipoprotein N-acyltransferase
VNYLWEDNFDWAKSKKSTIAFVAIVIAALIYGAIKTGSTSTEQSTVKIAAIILVPEEGDPVSMEQFWADRVVSPLEEGLARIGDLTRIAASNGARIVSFQELALIINEEDEARVKEEYKGIAKENDVYLSATYAYYALEGKGENKHLLINNNGEILLDYTKRYVTGLAELDLGEAGVYRKGPETIQSVDTPYGKIAISICRDMEFPHYMRQAGKADVDIMLSPAYEWPKGLVVHSVYMRAIENGFSLIRPTFNGRIISQMDSAETDDGILYAEVPTQGVNTIYTTLGDLLGWLSVLGLGVFIALSVIGRVIRKRAPSRQPVFD